ncbi:MAG: hypothetical protein KGL16_11155 [Acidobacteriota bacterium]|nr:hypothetical protein [Acidobacteriota bacterium]
MAAAAWLERPFDVEGPSTINVRVMEPTAAPGLVSYLDRLGLNALAGPDGTVRIRAWPGVEWQAAKVEILYCIDAWVRNHAIPVQLM